MPIVTRIPDFPSSDSRSKHTRYVDGDYFTETQPPLPDIDYDFLLNWNEVITSASYLGFGENVDPIEPNLGT